MEYTPINTLVPKSTYDFLEQYKDTPEFQRICDERMEIKNYKRSWASAPYAPMFITTDAVVVCKGHVLMVQRDVSPGEGTWAMPGGFLEQDETIKDGIFRELMEETKIDLPPAILHNSLTNVQVFDDPKRSLRGRTVTHAGLIELKNIKEFLPKVKGSDDARKARWLTFDAIRYLSDTNMIFEDHFHIIETLLKSQSI
jgi:bifunctional NMN adenylyltransferase/nudix hydrolase